LPAALREMPKLCFSSGKFCPREALENDVGDKNVIATRIEGELPEVGAVPRELTGVFQHAILHRHLSGKGLDLALAGFLIHAKYRDRSVCQTIGCDVAKCQILRAPIRRRIDENGPSIRIRFLDVVRSRRIEHVSGEVPTKVEAIADLLAGEQDHSRSVAERLQPMRLRSIGENGHAGRNYQWRLASQFVVPPRNGDHSPEVSRRGGNGRDFRRVRGMQRRQRLKQRQQRAARW
jgi:hypothetical protein